jgi:hypothetical protein
LSFFKLKPFGKASQILVINENGVNFYSIHVLITIYLSAPEDHEDLLKYLFDLIHNQIQEPDYISQAIYALMHSRLEDSEVMAICGSQMQFIGMFEYPFRFKPRMISSRKHNPVLQSLIKEGFNGSNTDDYANRGIEILCNLKSWALLFDASDEAIRRLSCRGGPLEHEIRIAIIYNRDPNLLTYMLEKCRVEEALLAFSSLLILPERYLPCLFKVPNIAEAYLDMLLSEFFTDMTFSYRLEMIRTMMRGLSAEQLDRVMVNEKQFLHPATDFVYNQEILNLWNTDRRPVIIKNIDQVINEPAMELALLASPIEALVQTSSDIPGNCPGFKYLVDIAISKKNNKAY